MSATPLRIGVPWRAPALWQCNGDHPLPSSLIHDYRDCVFTPDLAPVDSGMKSAAASGEILRRSLAAAAPDLSAAQIAELVASRLPESQAMMAAPCDLHFLHTAPMTFGARPWMLHFEENVTLFAPFVWHGRSANVAIREQPVYRLVKHLLEAPACRALFSHLRHSRDWLPTLFDSPPLAEKTHYVPLGIEFSPADTKLIAERQVARRGLSGTTFLFTNSWLQNDSSFMLRGGADAVRAFAALAARYPDVRLILLSRLPTSQCGPDFAAVVRQTPNLHVIDYRVSDDALVELMMSADVFVLPSAGLHALSILRAMYCGMATIVSDAPGNDEFIADGETGIVVPGRRGKTAWYDEIGFLHQTFESSFTGPSDDYAGKLFQAMEALHLNPDRRRQIGAAARRHVLAHHRIEDWRGGFERIIEKIRSTFL